MTPIDIFLRIMQAIFALILAESAYVIIIRIIKRDIDLLEVKGTIKGIFAAILVGAIFGFFYMMGFPAIVEGITYTQKLLNLIIYFFSCGIAIGIILYFFSFFNIKMTKERKNA